MGGDFLFIKLPNGRELAYYKPQVEPRKAPWGDMVDTVSYMTVNSQASGARKWERVFTYGGKLAENIIQAICRDIMVAAMFRVERAGCPVILTVHDEIVTETPVGNGSLTEFKRLMEKPPKWAKGLPIAVEAYEAERYRK